MKTASLVSIAGACLIAASALASEKWGYSEEKGPDNWGSLDPGFGACSGGKNQSPIDVSRTIHAMLPPIEFRYRTSASEIINNGHSIQANYASGSSIAVDGHVFELKQFHFHSPSENHINGRSFPMEAHLVHADGEGNLAVVAVMFDEGDANPAVASLWKQMPASRGFRSALASDVNASSLLPEDRSYYRFNGSLTTPPCSEGVWWFVMKQPMTLTRAQIELFTDAMGHPNNRPLQPLNARVILD